MVATKKYKHLGIVIPKEPAPIPSPPELPAQPFLIAAYGCRGSGKSTAIASMLRKYKEANAAHRIFLISPTHKSNKFLWEGLVDSDDVFEDANQASLDEVITRAESEAEEWKLYCENEIIWREYKQQERQFIDGRIPKIDEELLSAAIQAGVANMDSYPPYKWPGCKHPCLILCIDDCQSSSLFNPSTKVKNNLSNLAIKHRHVGGGREHGGLSIVVALQSYKSQTGVLSRALRSNMTACMIWGLRDEKMISNIHEEMGREIDEETFFAAYDYCIQDRHDCCMLEFSPLRIRRNLDEVLDLGSLPKKSEAIDNGSSTRRIPQVDEGTG